MLPLVRVFEKIQGLSNARNAAVSATKGEYIIWTDDDVLVDENWIAAYVTAFQDHPEAAIFGGPIKPWFEGIPPAWIKQSWVIIECAYATRDLGVRPFSLTQDHLPFGANFAISMTEQKKHSFNPQLGHVRDKILLGEETQVMKNILKTGGSGWWVPEPKVIHWIPSSKQNLKYIRKYFVGYGRTIRQENFRSVQWYKNPRWLFRKALQNECLYLISRCFCPPNIWMVYLRESSICWGMIFG